MPGLQGVPESPRPEPGVGSNEKDAQ
jgi:hypothetical protein